MGSPMAKVLVPMSGWVSWSVLLFAFGLAVLVWLDLPLRMLQLIMLEGLKL